MYKIADAYNIRLIHGLTAAKTFTRLIKSKDKINGRVTTERVGLQ